MLSIETAILLLGMFGIFLAGAGFGICFALWWVARREAIRRAEQIASSLPTIVSKFRSMQSMGGVMRTRDDA